MTDVFTSLSSRSSYTTPQLQMILATWVLAKFFERKGKISIANGHVSEDDYDKRSIYALLYSLYGSMGQVRDGNGSNYEFTFNTWGYDWPKEWGQSPTTARDPERFGMNAYSGLFAFDAIKAFVRAREGRVHVVEMGCGTGAGAHHVCKNVLPRCTYQAVDMQAAAIRTCQRKFVPELGGRLVALCADCTDMPIAAESADIVAVCETHVTEGTGSVSPEDERFFGTVSRILKPGGFLVWGNAIPDSTWQPCFDYLQSIGMSVIEVRDVTKNAIAARDLDAARIEAYVEQCVSRFLGFRIPVLGPRRRREAEWALKNFSRHPGTNLYDNMKTGTDSYRVVLVQKRA